MEDQIRQLRNRISEMEYQSRLAPEQNERFAQRSPGDSAKRSSIPVNTEQSPERLRGEFENQLRNLQQKNEGYQRDLTLLSSELERMAQLNLELKAKLDQARSQPAGSDRVSQVELDQVRMQLDTQYRNERVINKFS